MDRLDDGGSGFGEFGIAELTKITLFLFTAAEERNWQCYEIWGEQVQANANIPPA